MYVVMLYYCCTSSCIVQRYEALLGILEIRGHDHSKGKQIFFLVTGASLTWFIGSIVSLDYKVRS